MTTLDHLEQCLKAATSAPWKVDRTTYEGYTRVCNGRCKQGHDECDAIIAIDGLDHLGSNDADADLIVAAINALPSLLTLARAAEAMHDKALNDTRLDVPRLTSRDVLEKLGPAIAALSALKGSDE